MQPRQSVSRRMRQVDQRMAVKKTGKQKKQMFEKYLSFHLKYAYESYARSLYDIEAKLRSEVERSQLPGPQHLHAEEMIQIWTKALLDFKRLIKGNGTPEELETFNMFFNKKSYNSTEESQAKLFSFD